MNRLTPEVISRKLTKFKSSRGGVSPSLIVIHTTEGIMRLADRADFWHSGASAHVGVGAGKEREKSALYVKDVDKAWTQAFYNPVSLALEIEGFAAQKYWSPDTVREVARWVAHWSIYHDIPIRFG